MHCNARRWLPPVAPSHAVRKRTQRKDDEGGTRQRVGLFWW